MTSLSLWRNKGSPGTAPKSAERSLGHDMKTTYAFS